MRFRLFFLSLLFVFPTTVFADTKLPVPFTVQAPDGIWVEPWEDACEEAVITMVDAFYAKKPLAKEDAKVMIRRIVRFEMKQFGFHRDTNAAQMAEIINNYFPWEARVVNNPTLADIKAEIDAGRPVIVPVHGRTLRNRYFRDGGPDYHTIVIAGYDDDEKEFIVQEPGTKRGLDFRYPYDRIMTAMHDFLPYWRTRFGKPVAIFTSRRLTESGNTDVDGDGLSKLEELRYGSIIWLFDSDGDGLSDGEEVRLGLSPTKRNLATR